VTWGPPPPPPPGAPPLPPDGAQPPDGVPPQPSGGATPAPGSKKRSWRRWIVGGIAVVVVLIIIGAVAGPRPKSKNSSTSGTTAAAPGTTAAPTTAAPTTAPRTTPAPSSPKMTFGDGTWAVGKDIAAGTYQTNGGYGCYWERDKDFSGSPDSILANGNTTGHVVVTILPSDAAFESQNCGT
jgi:hypothetical protein